MIRRLSFTRKDDKVMFRRIIMTVVVVSAIAVAFTGFTQYV